MVLCLTSYLSLQSTIEETSFQIQKSLRQWEIRTWASPHLIILSEFKGNV